ncbi:PREDICTED: neuroblast differentiation-associated protein AHNAK-like [Cyprinodon variegatus]|uniref:Neuroblast differentiation-associated protein AHNAK-like n=1 Tax=Cyprinodon variegatus TaxID=28743 RepID=A0A3Q2D7U6_CYPVA|nr:PREDICTED: neuroblast differentiation-associated protein AHNAK-like [Cyprinodon variegatus]
MPTHRRGRSLSEALTLEESEEGGLVISSVTNDSHNLKEGDEILGATINFDQLSKEEVIKVLKLMEPYDDKVHVLTRGGLSKSMFNLDDCARNPEAMLKDSYSKLYNAKIKRFVKDDPSAANSSKVNPKHDMGLPRLGVDFGHLKSKPLSSDFDASLESEARDLTDGSNLNLPPLGVGDKGLRLNLNARNPQSCLGDISFSQKSPDGINGKINGPDAEVTTPHESLTIPSGKLSLKHSKRLKTPDLNLDDPSSFVKSPELRLSGKQMDLGNMDANALSGSVTLPNSGFSGGNSTDLATDTFLISNKGPSGNYKPPKFTMPKFDLPDIQVPGLNGNVELPEGDLKAPDLDVSAPNLRAGMNMPSINMPKADFKTPKLDLSGPKANLDMPSGKLKMPEIQGPDWDINAPSGKLKMPKMDISGTLPKGPNLDLNADLKSPDWSLKSPKIKGGMHAPDLPDLPDMNLKGPKLDVDTPDVNIGSPKGKFKMPKLKMPKFSLPGMKGPELDGNLNGPDIDVNAPDLNLKGPKTDLDFEKPGWSGKFKKPHLNLPDLNLSGPKIDSPNLDLRAPDLDVSGPNLRGGMNMPDINMPKADFKTPKLDLSGPEANLDMPSGKLKMPEIQGPNWDVNAPSGKLKMPKMNLSGTLPKGSNLDLDGDLKSPDFSLKAPKVKGGMNGFEGPDVDFGSPSRKGKRHKLKMPDVGFSAPKIDSYDLNAQKIKGGFESNLSLSSNDFKSSKPDFDVPDVDFGTSPFKLPNLKVPNVGFSSPKLDSPDLDFKTPKLSPKLPKGHNLTLNSDFNSPELNLRAPNMKAELGSLKLSDPNLNLQGSKFDMDTPDGNIGLPGANFKKSKKKMPNVFNADIPNELQGPGLIMPIAHSNVPKGSPKLRGPDLSLPALDLADVRLNGSRPSAKHPNVRMNNMIGQPEMKLSGPRGQGRFSGAQMGMNTSMIDIRDPHLRYPDLNIDDASINFKGASYKNRRSNMAGMSIKRPDLDIDQDIRFTHPNRKSSRTNVRSSNPATNNALHQYIDFNRPDLNIDDFTGKYHVPRARGSQLDLRAPSSYEQGIPSSYVESRNSRGLPAGTRNHNLHGFSHSSQLRGPEASDGYYVTIFPKQAQSQRVPNTKSNSMGRLSFPTGKMDLDVPDENYLKGSTFFFSNLV